MTRQALNYQFLIQTGRMLNDHSAFWFCKRNPYLRWRKPVVSVHVMSDEDGERRRLFRAHVMRQDRTGGWYRLWDEDGKQRFVFKLYASRDKEPNGIVGEIAQVLGGAVVGQSHQNLRGPSWWARRWLVLPARTWRLWREEW